MYKSNPDCSPVIRLGFFLSNKPSLSLLLVNKMFFVEQYKVWSFRIDS